MSTVYENHLIMEEINKDVEWNEHVEKMQQIDDAVLDDMAKEFGRIDG